MSSLTIKFNGQTYLATYNSQSGYYEVDFTAPLVGGVYDSEITFVDLLGQSYEDSQIVQVLAKEKLSIETDPKVFMWIFDYKDFTVKDIVELADYEINIDEETNASTLIKVLKETTAKADDIVAIKKDNDMAYWGIIDDIKNEDGKKVYEYTLKYITNMFNENVCLHNNIEDDEIPDGAYVIKSQVDPQKALDIAGASKANSANVQLWGCNNTGAQKFKVITNSDGSKQIRNINSNKVLDVYSAEFKDNSNVQQYESNNTNAQKWKIEHVEQSIYKIRTFTNSNYYLDVSGASPTEGTNIQIYSSNDTRAQKFFFQRLEEEIIKDVGIEDFIAKAIRENFTESKDTLINRDYLEIRVKTHTKLQATVSNVTDGMYNLATWMTNCTQLYNINYTFYVEDNKLILEIENKSLEKELIDTTAQAISNYTEVFEINVVSKVEVLTNTNTFYLYLLNDRTTTTNKDDPNRAEGRTQRVFTANYEDAEQKALDTMKGNSYNHNITFTMFNKYMKIGTPIAIKTKNSLVFDTYISAIKITKSKAVEYTCGNIRVKFIDKLLKERNK